MKAVVVIADDFTGACDTGVKLINREKLVKVFRCMPEREMACGEEHCSYSINTDSRYMAHENAYAAVRDAVDSLSAIQDVYYYKKIDSVLRGNIPTELDAMLDTPGLEMAVVAPAFPDAGRSIVDGNLFIKDENGNWQQNAHGGQTIYGAARNAGAMLNLETVRRGSKDICQSILEMKEAGIRIVLADAATNEDLKYIADAIVELEEEGVFPVGSAGLADALWSGDGLARNENSTGAIPAYGYVAVIVGSCHPVTVAQVQRFRELENFKVFTLELSDEHPELSSQEIDELFQKVKAAIERGEVKDGIVITSGLIMNTAPGTISSYDSKHDDRIASSIAKAVGRVVNELPFNKLFISGGDTANSVLREIGVASIQLWSEPVQGITLGSALTQMDKDLLISTKSGGFCEVNAIEHVANLLAAYNEKTAESSAV